MMLEVKVDLCEALTPKSCSKLVIHLIKYILYHSEQIPVNYDTIYSLLKKFEAQIDSTNGANGCSSLNTLSKMKAHKFYKTIELLYTSCERTFELIECELKESRGIRELVIVVGGTILSPKKIIRITIPNMSFIDCEKEHPVGRNLHSLCKHIVTSDIVHDYFRDKVGPTNIFVFLKMYSNHMPRTECFLPKEDFRFSRIGKEMVISLEQPKSNSCSCLVSLEEEPREILLVKSENSGNMDVLVNEELFTWYQSKVTIKGIAEKGNSLLNLLKRKS